MEHSENMSKPKRKLPKKDPGKNCNARTKRRTYCKNPAGFKTDHVGKGRCHLHGGNAPKGTEHYNFKDGLRSKYGLPEKRYARLLEMFDSNPDLLELRDQVTRLKTRQYEIEEMMEAGGGPEQWKKLKEIVGKAQLIRKSEGALEKTANVEAFMNLVLQMFDVIETGASDTELWEQSIELSGKIARLSQTETLRQAQDEMLYSVSQVVTIISVLIKAQVKYFENEETLDRFIEDVEPFLEGIDKGIVHELVPVGEDD